MTEINQSFQYFRVFNDQFKQPDVRQIPVCMELNLKHIDTATM